MTQNAYSFIRMERKDTDDWVSASRSFEIEAVRDIEAGVRRLGLMYKEGLGRY